MQFLAKLNVKSEFTIFLNEKFQGYFRMENKSKIKNENRLNNFGNFYFSIQILERGTTFSIQN